MGGAKNTVENGTFFCNPDRCRYFVPVIDFKELEVHGRVIAESSGTIGDIGT